jgi:hypothetical protein
MNDRDIVVTGLPSSGTTITAALLSKGSELVVDHVVFPHGQKSPGDPYWKELPEAKLTVLVKRAADFQKASWDKMGYGDDVRGEANQRLKDSIADRDVLQIFYEWVVNNPDRVIERVAEKLGISPWPVGVEIYDGNAKYA